MGISAAEMGRRIQALAKITVLREMVNEELIKEEDTLRMLKEQDFLEGDIYGNGAKDTYASSLYSGFKKKQNPIAGGNVDLILTGAFIDSFKLNKPKENRYLFGATDPKKSILVGKYGIDIMGLNQEVFNKFQKEIIAPRFVQKIKDQLNR